METPFQYTQVRSTCWMARWLDDYCRCRGRGKPYGAFALRIRTEYFGQCCCRAAQRTRAEFYYLYVQRPPWGMGDVVTDRQHEAARRCDTVSMGRATPAAGGMTQILRSAGQLRSALEIEYPAGGIDGIEGT